VRVAARAGVLGRADVADAAQRVEQRVSHLGRRVGLWCTSGASGVEGTAACRSRRANCRKKTKQDNAKDYANAVKMSSFDFPPNFRWGSQINYAGVIDKLLIRISCVPVFLFAAK
jgi:hypothetical protein